MQRKLFAPNNPAQIAEIPGLYISESVSPLHLLYAFPC
jgi:hypothetical protein